MATTTQFEAGAVAANYRQYLEPVLFAPWAERLVAHAGVRPGDVVVDLAAGTGAVTRVAARVAGSDGRVVATDISARMLAFAVRGARPGSAAVTTSVCAAGALDLDDGSADVVLCQQGLQFMPDRAQVLRECRRVLRPGGTLAVAVWAAGEPLAPFDAFASALSTEERELSNQSVTMSVHSIVDALCLAGFTDVSAGLRSLVVRWPTLDAEVAGVFGTPFGPLVERLDETARTDVLARLRRMLGDGQDRTFDHRTTSVFGRASRPAS